MTPKRLAKLKRELTALARASVTARDMEQIASALGRQKVKRGKEPTWEQTELENRPPLAIPHHGSANLSPGVKSATIAVLSRDVECWEEKLSFDEEHDEDEGEED